MQTEDGGGWGWMERRCPAMGKWEGNEKNQADPRPPKKRGVVEFGVMVGILGLAPNDVMMAGRKCINPVLGTL